MSAGSWRRRGSRALPHLGRRRRALGLRLGPRRPDTAGQDHEPRRVAGRGRHQGRLHRRGAQVDAESDRRCSHGHGEQLTSRRLGGAPSRTLQRGPRRRGGALQPAQPYTERRRKAGPNGSHPVRPRLRGRGGGCRPRTVPAFLSKAGQSSLTGARGSEGLCVSKGDFILPDNTAPIPAEVPAPPPLRSNPTPPKGPQ